MTIIGTEKETDYVIEQMAYGSCDGCPAYKTCKGEKRKKEYDKDNGESCGEAIRKHIKIIKVTRSERDAGDHGIL